MGKKLIVSIVVAYSLVSFAIFSFVVIGGDTRRSENYDHYDTSNFIESSNYDYNDTKLEMSSNGVRLRDLRPDGALFYSNFDTENGTWGNGLMNGTIGSNGTITDGKLNLTGTTAYIMYEPLGNADFTQTGAIRFTYIPNHDGYGIANFFDIRSSSYSGNRIYFRQNIQYLELIVRDYLGNEQINTDFNVLFTEWWSCNKGQAYEFELNFDFNNLGADTKLFIDGVQHGDSISTYFMRNTTLDYFMFGDRSDGLFDDLIIFDEVQHTSTYTTGQPISDIIMYQDEPTVELEDGIIYNDTIQSFETSFVENGDSDIGYVISDDNGTSWKYWNGANWVVSNGSYAESNNESIVNQYIGNFSSSGVFSFKAFMISNDGVNSPVLYNVSIVTVQQRIAGSVVGLDVIMLTSLMLLVPFVAVVSMYSINVYRKKPKKMKVVLTPIPKPKFKEEKIVTKRSTVMYQVPSTNPSEPPHLVKNDVIKKKDSKEDDLIFVSDIRANELIEERKKAYQEALDRQKEYRDELARKRALLEEKKRRYNSVTNS